MAEREKETGPVGAGPEPPPKTGFDVQTFSWIVFMALGGVVLSVSAAASFEHYWCVPAFGVGPVGVCAAIRQSPPWIPLASLASAPSLLLTWYWRTTHKKRDLDQKDRDLQQKDREHAHTLTVQERQRLDAIRVDIRAAALELRGNIGEGGPALVRLAYAANEPALAQELADVVALFMRASRTGSIAQAARDRDLIHRFTTMTLLSDLRMQSEIKIDLRHGDLSRLHLSNLDLRGANLWKANLTDTRLEGVNLTDANLDGVEAPGARYDSATKLSERARAALNSGGAKELERIEVE